MKPIGIKITACLFALILLLSGCGYTSLYHAVGCVRTNTEKDAALSFFELKGSIVFKMKQKEHKEGAISYSAHLETGALTVYYVYRGKKTELFTLGDRESAIGTAGYIEKGPVYIIVKTDGKCENGNLQFSIEEP